MVAKGMAALFAKVQANPKDERLLHRVLALIADIRNVPERAAAAMELSSMLVDAAPREAMRIAHMVYRADRTSLQALEVVIACLKKLGRAAKAEILSNELRKLHGLQKIEGPPDADRQVIMTPRGAKEKKPFPKKPEFSSGPDISRSAHAEPSLRHEPVEKPLAPPRSVRSEFSLIAPLGNDQIIGASANNIPGFSELDLKEFSQIAAIANATPEEYVPDSLPWGAGSPDPGSPGAPASPNEGVRGGFVAPEPTSIDAAIAASMDNPDEMFQSATEPEEESAPVKSGPVGGSNQAGESPRKTVLSVNFEPGASPSPVVTPDATFGDKERHTQISGYRSPIKKSVKSEAKSESPPAYVHDATDEDANEDMIAAAELFDYYWQQGFMKEARDLLNQTAAVCSEAHWWRARKNLLRSSRIGRTTEEIRGQGKAPSVVEVTKTSVAEGGPLTMIPEPPAGLSAAPYKASSLTSVAAVAAVPPAPVIPVTSALPGAPLASEPFWAPLLAELASLAAKAEAVKGRMQRSPRVKLSKGDHRLDVAVTGALETVADQSVLWEMVQALWGAAPGQDCLDFLKKKQLTRATPGFWGIYLDAMLGVGQHRAALQEIRSTLKEHRQLPWASAAYARIPLVLELLSVRSFKWEEADGVAALLEKVSKRQAPLARGLFVGTEQR